MHTCRGIPEQALKPPLRFVLSGLSGIDLRDVALIVLVSIARVFLVGYRYGSRKSPDRRVEFRLFHVVDRVVIRCLYPLEIAPTGVRDTANRAQTLENGLGGRDRQDFGTVRPRVQIPGPRPKSEYDSGVRPPAERATDQSRITYSRNQTVLPGHRTRGRHRELSSCRLMVVAGNPDLAQSAVDRPKIEI
jgi:hypothetical protein